MKMSEIPERMTMLKNLYQKQNPLVLNSDSAIQNSNGDFILLPRIV